MIIGLHGKAGSGKDTAAAYMSALTNDYGLAAFADPIRRAACIIFDLDMSYFIDRKKKEKVVPRWGITPREMLQKLGTEGGRDIFGPDIWVKRMASKYEPMQKISEEEHQKTGKPRNLIITDVRFINEAKWIHSVGGCIIDIVRPDLQLIATSDHASEDGLPPEYINFMITNDVSLEELKSISQAMFHHVAVQV